MEVLEGGSPFPSYLPFLLAQELNHAEVLPMKKTIMQGIDETLANDFVLGFKVGNNE